jgi:acyl carrier protein
MSNNGNAPQDVDLTAWLVERVAFYLDRPTEAIRPDVHLAEYGMDSLYSVSVISDIEDLLNLDLDATTLREHATINALAGHLEELLSSDPVGKAPHPGRTS